MDNIIKFDRDPEELFELMENIGQGNYGSVHKAKLKQSDTIVAIKIIPDSSDIECLKKEIAILK